MAKTTSTPKRRQRKPASKALQASPDAVRRSAPKPVASPYQLDSWLAGYEAGLCRKKMEPPRMIPFGLGRQKTCTASWTAGFLEGHAHARAADLLPGLNLNDGQFCNPTSSMFVRAFMAGVRHAAQQAWQPTPAWRLM